MQHFSKQLRTRLLTLYLSAGLVMGWLPGCGSQDLEIADIYIDDGYSGLCAIFVPSDRVSRKAV